MERGSLHSSRWWEKMNWPKSGAVVHLVYPSIYIPLCSTRCAGSSYKISSNFKQIWKYETQTDIKINSTRFSKFQQIPGFFSIGQMHCYYTSQCYVPKKWNAIVHLDTECLWYCVRHNSEVYKVVLVLKSLNQLQGHCPDILAMVSSKCPTLDVSHMIQSRIFSFVHGH
jgi:hypothetical protein